VEEVAQSCDADQKALVLLGSVFVVVKSPHRDYAKLLQAVVPVCGVGYVPSCTYSFVVRLLLESMSTMAELG
jgi:hypothetical protein